MKQWPYFVGALGVAGVIGLLIARGEPLGIGTDAPAAAPGKPLEPRGRIDGPIVVFPGLTYFAAVETNGAVDAAATVARVKAHAEKEGFRDVVVAEGAPLAHWPLSGAGDYFVRGTFAGAAPKAFPRRVSVFLGSANLLDAIEV